VQFVIFAVSTANSISFSTYFLKAVTLGSQDDTWLNRGVAVAAISGEFEPTTFSLVSFLLSFISSLEWSEAIQAV
jgi:hypothetical protein